MIIVRSLLKLNKLLIIFISVNSSRRSRRNSSVRSISLLQRDWSRPRERLKNLWRSSSTSQSQCWRIYYGWELGAIRYLAGARDWRKSYPCSSSLNLETWTYWWIRNKRLHIFSSCFFWSTARNIDDLLRVSF